MLLVLIDTLPGPHFDGAIRPLMREPHRQMAAALEPGKRFGLVERQLVTAARLRVADLLQHRHGRLNAGPQPDGDRECLLEVADVAEAHVNLAVEVGGAANRTVEVADLAVERAPMPVI